MVGRQPGFREADERLQRPIDVGDQPEACARTAAAGSAH